MSAAVPAIGFDNPFPGLRPFRDDEQKLFFGREAQVDRMVDKLAANRFLAVVGSSGSGKSSLVNCGFKPALRCGLLTSAGSSWRMVQFRPGANPNVALARALVQDGGIIPTFGSAPPRPEAIAGMMALSGYGLVDIFKRSKLEPETNLLVVVDQFEELFRYRGLSAGAGGYGHGPEAVRFVRLLLDSVRQREVPIYVVLTMRSDFLGDCAQFDGLAEAISEGQYLVPRMTRDERRAAIQGPIRVVNSTISPALLNRLVNDVGDNPDQLSILQHAMNRTWAHWRYDRSGHGPITAADYEAVGTMGMALHNHAEKAYGELVGERQQLICMRVFKALTDRGTDPRGIRRPTQLSKLCEIAGATQDEVLVVLRPFRKASRSFLVPAEKDPIDETSIVDISHESLMRVWVKLSLWADEEAESAREYRRLLDRAEVHGQDRAGLMQDPDLQAALDFWARQQPTPAWGELYGGKFEQTDKYLRDSQEQRVQGRADKEVERRWQSRWQPLILGILALAFLYVLFHFRDSLMPPTPAVQSAKKDLSAAFHDAAKYGWRSGMVIGSFIAAGYGALQFGRSLHRRIIRKSIVALLRNPPPTVPKQAKEQGGGTVELGFATAGRRAVAFLIDFLIGFVFLVLAFSVAISVAPGFSAWFGGWFLLVCLYHVLTEGSRWQASLGMRLAKIYVSTLDGRRLSRWGALKREVCKLLWFIMCGFYLLPLVVYRCVYGWVKRKNPDSPMVRQHQWPQDIWSKTVVAVGKPAKTATAVSKAVASAELVRV